VENGASDITGLAAILDHGKKYRRNHQANDSNTAHPQGQQHPLQRCYAICRAVGHRLNHGLPRLAQQIHRQQHCSHGATVI
jgi:hypothetical protein